MEKELTSKGIKEGGSLWLIVALFGFGVKSYEAGEMYIAGASIFMTVVLALVREYYKPN